MTFQKPLHTNQQTHDQVMNPKETMPVLVKLAPVLATAGPPALIGVAIGLALLWVFSGDKKEEPQTPNPAPELPPSAIEVKTLPASAMHGAPLPKVANRRITREDIAEALEYGTRGVTRGEAVAALQALGFQKTAAYKALSASGRFAELIEIAPDGLIEWKG